MQDDDWAYTLSRNKMENILRWRCNFPERIWWDSKYLWALLDDYTIDGQINYKHMIESIRGEAPSLQVDDSVASSSVIGFEDEARVIM